MPTTVGGGEGIWVLGEEEDEVEKGREMGQNQESNLSIIEFIFQ